jgi:putative transposase
LSSELNSMARQSAAERSWSAIARFYDNCKKRKVEPVRSCRPASESNWRGAEASSDPSFVRGKVKSKKGFPKFQKHCRSVEYKTSGWKLSTTRKGITFSDKKGIGTLKLKGTYDLNYYDIKQIKRVRLVRRESRLLCSICN